jgi:dolichol kinase
MLAVIIISYILSSLLFSNIIIIPIILGISFFIFDIIDFKFDDNFILPLGMSLICNLLEVIL